MARSFDQNILAIKDDKISLIINHIIDKETIYELTDACFDIVLNDTKQTIGNICFDYTLSEGFDYSGNVGYTIDEEYRNMGYASKALKLLKEFIKEISFTGDKDLYVAMLPENIYSEKVAINNGGILCYEGSIPKEHIIRITENIKDVKVYKIKM